MRRLSVFLALLLSSTAVFAAAPAAPAANAPAIPQLLQVGKFPEQLVDTDHDGVPDIDDNCPGTPKLTPTRAGTLPTVVDICGCPLDPCTTDADGDGVKDCDDACPGTAKGLVVDARGCPRPQKKPQQFRLDVKFAFAQANLQDRFVPDLERLRALLVRFPELTVTLEGHTDFIGSAAYNQSLSQVRAEKCRRYLLEDSRIAPSRVIAIGYGKSRPIADNGSDDGRAQNRRTVAVLQYAYEFTPPNSGDNLPP